MRATPLLLGCLLVLGCLPERATPASVQIFAAASTVDAVRALAAEYQARTGIEVHASFAGSSTLARQIDAGAQADLFLSAHTEWMAYLQSRGWLGSEEAEVVLSNQLVLIAPKGRGFPVQLVADFDLAGCFRGPIALADPEHVPAGRYAREALRALGWWPALQPRVLAALDVRHALTLVELAECRLGIVYASDARASGQVEILGTFQADVRYWLAIGGDAQPAARDFAAFLKSEAAQQVFQRLGFGKP